MRALAFALLSLAACTKVSATYCDKHPDDFERCAGDGACVLDSDCEASDPSAPVCLDRTSCVQCALPDRTSACTGATPVCGADNLCHACTSHDECGSGVCLSSGACAATSEVSYVQEGGAGSECTSGAPCGSLELARQTNRPIIKVTGAIVDDKLASFTAGSFQVFGTPGARISRSNAGPLVEVKGTASVTIHDLRLTGAASDAIQQSDPGSTLALHRVVIDENAGYGISANRGTLTMDGCVVSGNNAGGVSALDVTFTITSSIFVVNGDASASTVGGLRLAPVGASSFEFNTVADNASTIGNEATRSLNCTAALTVRNNIFRTNWPNTTGVGGACTAQFSLFDMTAPATGDNKTGDPMFEVVNPLEPTHPQYYRIKPGSPAVDSADPGAPPTSDIDGDPRPSNGRSDIGADELL